LAVIPKKIFHFDLAAALFLSPVAGLTISILFIFTYNRFGFPIKNIGTSSFYSILFLSIFAVVRHRSSGIPPTLFGKVLFAPLGILFTAWPILRYGFSWISYVNDDMNNYVLAATRFFNFGFFDKPNQDFFAGRDYSQVYYYFHVLSGVRPGSELYLAAYSKLHHGDTLAIFMPAILTLQIVLIFSILAVSRTMSLRTKSITRFSYLLSLLLPLTSLGFLYQLIGQVGGLAIGTGLIALISILLTQDEFRTWRSSFLILALLLAAQMIWYPEFLPFIAIPTALKMLMAKRGRRLMLWRTSLGILVVTAIVLNRYFYAAIKFGMTQLAGAQKSVAGVNANSQLFPYFLKPHGLPSGIGFTPLNRWSNDPWESLIVFLSFLLVIATIYFVIKRKFYREFVVSIFLFIEATSCYLILSKSGFGAFKIAMYVQPFLIPSTALILVYLWRKIHQNNFKKTIFIMTVSIALVLTARTSQFYAAASTGTSSNGFNEIQAGSNSGIKSLMVNALSKYRTNSGPVVSTTLNYSQMKLEANAAMGIPLIFPTTDIFANFFDSSKVPNSTIGRELVKFNTGFGENSFSQIAVQSRGRQIPSNYLVSTNPFDSINKSKFRKQNTTWNYTLETNPSNLLIFIDSDMGRSYYSWQSQREKAVIFQPERNPLVAGAYMQSIGRNLLFEVIRPSKNPYLALEMTTTVMPQYGRVIPPISILGKTRAKLKTIGNGSFRVFLPLVKPFEINGHQYFQLHIDQTLKPFPTHLSLISNLYGKTIQIDSRRVAIFASNISVIDESEIHPSSGTRLISRFPTDLVKGTFAYSGVYEDGWISRKSFFELNSSHSHKFVISGLIPVLNPKSPPKIGMEVRIDGKLLVKAALGGGDFTQSISLNQSGLGEGLHHIEINFSDEQSLPNPDGRPASALIKKLGFV